MTSITVSTSLYTICCIALAQKPFLPEKNVAAHLRRTQQWQFSIHVAGMLNLTDTELFDVYWGLSPLFRNR